MHRDGHVLTITYEKLLEIYFQNRNSVIISSF